MCGHDRLCAIRYGFVNPHLLRAEPVSRTTKMRLNLATARMRDYCFVGDRNEMIMSTIIRPHSALNSDRMSRRQPPPLRSRLPSTAVCIHNRGIQLQSSRVAVCGFWEQPLSLSTWASCIWVSAASSSIVEAQR